MHTLCITHRPVENKVHVPPPKKLDEEEAARLAQQSTAATQGASAWNSAGVFEERDHMTWLKERLTAKFSEGAVQSSSGGCSLDVTGVVKDSVTGHCTVIFSRGKKVRAGFSRFDESFCSHTLLIEQ